MTSEYTKKKLMRQAQKTVMTILILRFVFLVMHLDPD